MRRHKRQAAQPIVASVTEGSLTWLPVPAHDDA